MVTSIIAVLFPLVACFFVGKIFITKINMFKGGRPWLYVTVFLLTWLCCAHLGQVFKPAINCWGIDTLQLLVYEGPLSGVTFLSGEHLKFIFVWCTLGLFFSGFVIFLTVLMQNHIKPMQKIIPATLTSIFRFVVILVIAAGLGTNFMAYGVTFDEIPDMLFNSASVVITNGIETTSEITSEAADAAGEEADEKFIPESIKIMYEAELQAAKERNNPPDE